MIQLHRICYLSVWAWLGTAHAATESSLSLASALGLALQHNPALRASGARHEGARGREVQAGSLPNPELELSIEDMPVDHGRFGQAKHMAGISQTLPYPGKRQASRHAAAAGTAAAAADWRWARAELIREVSVAYWQAQSAERAAAVARDLIVVAEAAAGAAQKRQNAGESTLQESLRAEIELEHTRSNGVSAQREASEARQELARLLGMTALGARTLSTPLAESADAARGSGQSTSWLHGHPAVLAAQARCEQARAAAQREGLEPRPDVKIGLAAGRDEVAEENLMELRLTFPLPLIDRNKGRKAEAMAAIAEAEADLASTEQRLLAAWRNAAARYQAASQQVRAHRERILPKSEQALALVRRGFDEGKFGVVDMLDIQRTTAEARMNYQKKLFELNAASAELDALAGRSPTVATSNISKP